MFQRKCIVVTGAGGGIGAATAKSFARQGGRVALLDIDAERAEAVAAEIRDAGGEARSYGVDITDRDACSKFARALRDEVGLCDVLVNNAGVHLRERFTDPDVREQIQRTFDINVFGMLNMTMSLLDDLRSTRGVIVNLASIGSFVTANTSAGYGPSKAAVKLFTQTFAQQLAGDGIRVNAVAPGIVATQMSASMRAKDEAAAWFLGRTPLARFAEPDEIAQPILFLASPQASYITGATLPVDGGFLSI